MKTGLGACCALFSALLLPSVAQAQFAEQAELTGAPSTETGHSVALSADGNTAILGAPADNNWIGSAAVYVRVNGQWTKQATLAAPDAIGGANQGNGVALSADGNTAIVGGPVDNDFTGAAWVYVRSGQNWTEQAKLVGTAFEETGWSVSLSADGNTALLGAPSDDSAIGAAWVFTRSAGAWSQQAKLVGTGVIGGWAGQGDAVALSADGRTAILGGDFDGPSNQIIPTGAAWVFRRSTTGAWSQDIKLVANDPTLRWQGQAVALSGHGNVAIVGSIGVPNPTTGAYTAGGAWIYTRAADGVWDQTAKLAGVDPRRYPYPAEAYSVSLAANGRLALVGGWYGADNAQIAPGAGYLFVRSPAGVWRQWGHALVGNNPEGLAQGSSGALSADGRTVVLGGPSFAYESAAWVFARSAPALAAR